MMRNGANTANEIKKLQLEEVVLFAMNNIPQTDVTTLKQFLELVNAGGTFGTISHQQILKRMHQVLKYVPGASMETFLVLMDLLEIEPPQRLPLNPPQSGWLKPEAQQYSTAAFFVET